MSRYTITVQGKGLQQRSVDKLLGELRALKETSVSLVNSEPPTSRADRLSAAMDLVSDAASEVESLKDELQEWHDNLPENLQQGGKADELQTAIDELEQIYDALTGVDGSSVDFPGMY